MPCLNTPRISQERLARAVPWTMTVPPLYRVGNPTHRLQARAKYSQEQLEFLERKKTGKMPYSCTHCDGSGDVACQTCQGTGQNAEGLAERLFDLKNGVHQRAPDINLQYLFMEEMPCFICKGVGTCPCSSCSGTGIANFAEKFAPTD